METSTLLERTENPSTERVWHWLVWTTPFLLAITFVPVLVPGEFWIWARCHC